MNLGQEARSREVILEAEKTYFEMAARGEAGLEQVYGDEYTIRWTRQDTQYYLQTEPTHTASMLQLTAPTNEEGVLVTRYVYTPTGLVAAYKFNLSMDDLVSPDIQQRLTAYEVVMEELDEGIPSVGDRADFQYHFLSPLS
jgi:hypothetical protein